MNTEMLNDVNDVNANPVAETPVVEDATMMDTVNNTVSTASSEFMEGAKSVLKPKGLGGAVVTAGITAAIVGAGWLSVKVGKKCASFFTKIVDSASKIVAKKVEEKKTEKPENKKETEETQGTQETINTTASEVKEEE